MGIAIDLIPSLFPKLSLRSSLLEPLGIADESVIPANVLSDHPRAETNCNPARAPLRWGA
jgi:hypothetical protein